MNGSRTKADPWKRNEVSDETDLLQTWQNAEDPISRAELLHVQLLKHFGDRSEVHTIRNYQIDAANGIPSTIDKDRTYAIFPRILTYYTHLARFQTSPAKGLRKS